MTKPEPVGWWCKGCNSFQKCNDGYCQTYDCKVPEKIPPFRLQPVYTRTQVRKGFEELAGWCEDEAALSKYRQWPEEYKQTAIVIRRRMEEW